MVLVLGADDSVVHRRGIAHRIGAGKRPPPRSRMIWHACTSALDH
jgi:hypothetical protein